MSDQETKLVWQSITFGQSTDLNYAGKALPEKIGVNYAAPEYPGTIEGKIILESRGGKMAPGHDGMTFYYTKLKPNKDNFVLEADITIEQFGPENGAGPNRQESAGIMVRDAIGAPRQDPMIFGYEEVPAASNLFAVGMMRHGVSPLYRTGVVYPWGNTGSILIDDPFTNDSAFQVPCGIPFRARLERTDTEFIMSVTFTHLSEGKKFEHRVKGADYVQVLDPEHMYVGFYAARNARMVVENARLTLSEAHTVPSPAAEPKPVAPSINLVSAPTCGSENYEVKVVANAEGTLKLLKDGIEVVRGALVAEDKFFSFHTLLEKEITEFIVIFTAADEAAEPIRKSLTVTKRIFQNGAGLFVSPNGTSGGKGTLEEPLDLETAIQYVLPGEIIYLLEGTYKPSSTIIIPKEYSGTPDRLKTLMAYGNGKVVIDGQEKLPNVIFLQADYWHLKGVEVTRAARSGMRLSGDHNVIESMIFSYNGDTGFILSGVGSAPECWPKYNLILNCESHDNRDATDDNADGFAAKLGVGEGNIFRGNISHHNIDDGWDLFNRANEGPNMPITLEGNISYSNGKLSNGYRKDGNSGSGFKLGGEGLPVNHIVRGNIAFDNNLDGFTDNFNPGQLLLEDNIAFNNKRCNFIFRISPYFKPEQQSVFRNNLSIRTSTGAPKDFISGTSDETNFFFDGTQTMNSLGKVISPEEFVNLDMPEKFNRNEEGNIIVGDFLRRGQNA
ncbi:right-handed parallel beta-helix repeat-containing protein [Neobacillus dielmonensis]|uniref:right-handed parallel beta-helix repeat-containing protein n=1 Tax=Neobacillus dielmonensis TaxID=1347369 RepID=UPI000693E95F|nr:right-handed parallel beta-helix repeat-containing protein [Neobacillus dielmonensis]